MNYLLDRLQKDIINDLLIEFNDDLKCDKEKYFEMITIQVKKYFSQNSNEITFEKDNTKKGCNYRDRDLYSYDDNNCMARIWNEGYGGQCSRKKNSDNYFCLKHQRIHDTNKLWLRKITEERPDPPIYNGKIKNWKN